MNYWNSRFKVKGPPKLKRSWIKRSGRVTLRTKPESPAEKKFKRAVRERDNYTCQYPGCDFKSKRIDVHHKAKRSQRPDLRLDVDNGICLCRKHHGATDTERSEAIRLGLLNTETYELAKKKEREAA